MTRLAKALRKIAVAFLSAPIHAYRILLSPMLPRACRFEPSCSCYALEAISVHGPVKGGAMALKRLSHCHPFPALGGRSGYDPVPMKRPQAQ